MNETIIAKRVFKATKPNGKGIVVATAMLHQLGDQKPYFSVTTDHGCDHDSILSAMPHLKPLVDLHLSDKDGMPMHAKANGEYHMRERKVEYVASHFRVDTQTARDMIDEYHWDSHDNIGVAVMRVMNTVKRYQEEVLDQMPELLKLDSKIETYRTYQVPEQLPKGLRRLRVFLGMVDPTRRFRGRPQGKYLDNPYDPNWYTGGKIPDYTKALLDRTSFIPLFWEMYIQEARSMASRVGVGDKTLNRRLKDCRDLLSDLKEFFGDQNGVDSPMVRTIRNQLTQQYMTDLIDGCFKSCWKRQADAAMEMLQGSDDPDIEAEYEEGTPLIRYEGDVIEIENTNNYADLPMADCGVYEFYIATSSEEAGEAAKKYWIDMSENDKREFVCMVGEENIVKWAMGDSAGPGSTQVSSMEEWFDLWLNTPEEQWASYDGEEHTAGINEAAAEELGLDFEPTYTENDIEWMRVVVYRHN